MLILTRKVSESVDLIDKRSNERLGTIRILGQAANGDVRIGFDCPSHVMIERDDMKRRNNGDEKSDGGYDVEDDYDAG